jgi:hypothetical protein
MKTTFAKPYSPRSEGHSRAPTRSRDLLQRWIQVQVANEGNRTDMGGSIREVHRLGIGLRDPRAHERGVVVNLDRLQGQGLCLGVLSCSDLAQ